MKRMISVSLRALSALLLLSSVACQKEHPEAVDASTPRTGIMASTTESQYYLGLDDFMARAQNGVPFETMEVNRALRYLEASLNYRICDMNNPVGRVAMDSTDVPFTVFSGALADSLTGLEIRRLDTVLRDTIIHLGMHTLFGQNGPRFMKIADLAWQDGSGANTHIPLQHVRVYTHMAMNATPPSGSCLLPEAFAFVDFFPGATCGNTGLAAYKHIQAQLNDPVCNPQTCVQVLGTDQGMGFGYVDIERGTKRGYVTGSENHCLTQFAVNDIFIRCISTANSRRPDAFPGATFKKAIKHAFSLSTVPLGNNHLQYSHVYVYGNCKYNPVLPPGTDKPVWRDIE